MRIALINGSPKPTGSTSGLLLDILAHCLTGQAEVVPLSLRKPDVSPDVRAQLETCKAWVLAFPLYVDSVPSHLLACLEQLEQTARGHKPHVYAVVNCGFYEGRQTEPAMEIVGNFCAKADCTWGGGTGVGGGEALHQLPEVPGGKGPRGPVDLALDRLARNILAGNTRPCEYVQIAFPRLLYKLAGQMGWRQKIKQNGGKAKDLNRRIP